MKKLICALVLAMIISPLLAESSVQNTPNIDVIDTPTSNTLLRGMYNFHMRFYESGGVLTRAWVGFSNNFMIGATFNLDNVVGVGAITGREPKVLAKLRLIDDSTAFPSLAIGYEPQSFGFYLGGANFAYSVKPIGAYAVVTKQLGILYLNGGVNNHNVWTNFTFSSDLGIFAGGTVMLNPDFAVLVEYNDISLPSNSLNLGFRYAFAPELRIEVDIKGLTGDSTGYVRNLRLDYTNYF